MASLRLRSMELKSSPKNVWSGCSILRVKSQSKVSVWGSGWTGITPTSPTPTKTSPRFGIFLKNAPKRDGLCAKIALWRGVLGAERH